MAKTMVVVCNISYVALFAVGCFPNARAFVIPNSVIPRFLALSQPQQQTLPSSLLLSSGSAPSSDLSAADTSSSATTTTPSSTTTSSTRLFENFSYQSRWYPVIWARDLLLNEPTKVTVFDVDYVVAKTSDTEVLALEDRCPHKAAALSEGRITASGNFQCAYHGWAFDGTTGVCKDIPQLAQVDSGGGGGGGVTFPSRSCATAIPAQIHQEMVYLFLGGSAEEALLAPPPPTVTEYDTLGFRMSCSIRDMPVDWPIVVSNICDAEHGAFAHQAKAFDMYSSSKEHPLQVVQEFPNNGKDWIVRTKVDASTKLLHVDRQRRLQNGEKVKQDVEKDTPWATTMFQAPFHLQMRRLDKKTNTTSFVSAFYICPVGVGRCRFMAAGLSKVAPPRWVTKLALDNFLDQDTYLLATQQHFILSSEADDVRELMKKRQKENYSTERDLEMESMNTRRQLFCLSTPNDAFGAKLEQFWDATLLRSPNRIKNLMKLDSAGAFLETASRNVVLDRKTQHLDICPDSQAALRNCQRTRLVGALLAATLICTKSLLPVMMKYQVARQLDGFLRPFSVVAVSSLSLVIGGIAHKMCREYFFKYTPDYRRKDMSKIPKLIWKDV
ncbi:Rieske domain containing protein [Nitzschia inconspicua]|uniref:Rieske domain containing protein n=1 Tax=Nitzschia inconspicua TaxID=303405 RepID=A0A9K3LVP3_9STRA|nr:Rieske domain containing protein [Nitzschia inconspicua]